MLLLAAAGAGGLLPGARAAVTIQNSYPVTTVSAASYVGSPAPLAPNSIVAAFGTQLAIGTQSAATQPLPTTLLGTTVTVNNIPAQLFFVSPNQINYLIPANVPAGDTQVVVTATQGNGDQIVSRGQVRIAGTGPSIFTADASGSGAPAAETGRINQNNQFVYDPVRPYGPDPANPGRIVPTPIDVGTAERPAYLILYGTGLRNAPVNAVRAVFGGIEIPVDFYGVAPGYTGLDQVNLKIPVSLKGRGLVDVSMVVNGVASNAVTVNLAGSASQALSVSGFSVNTPTLAGQTVTIQGNGFSATANQNIVRFGGAQAKVVSATANQLTVIVPFGAQSGQVTVQANQVEARSTAVFKVKTSISGIVQSTGSVSSQPGPLNNVTVRLAGTNLSVRTNPQGTFVLSDIPAGVSLIEIDGGTNTANPPFPAVTLKLVAKADQDNQFKQPISLQQINGGSGTVGAMPGSGDGGPLTRMRGRFLASYRESRATGGSAPSLKQQLPPSGKSTTISNRGVTLEVPLGTTVRFPDGKSSGQVQLTVVEKSRLPGITLPSGIYSSTIAQITPIETKFSPGASLSFPNPDPATLAGGAKVDLYRYDSATGGFIKRGTGTVTADKALVVSDGRIVDVATFWFAALATGVTTVTGRVIDSLGFPVVGAKVTVNGRADSSDQNGGFSLADVSTAGVSTIQAEAVVPQQYGTPPRGLSSVTPVVIGGITNVGTIALSDTDQAGLVLSPFVLDLTPTSPPTPISVTLTQPAPSGGLLVTLTSDDATVVTVPANVTIAAGQTSAAFNVTRVGPGVALIEAKATLSSTLLETFAVVSVALPGPTLTGVSPTTAPVGAPITITGTGFSVVPDNHFVVFQRNNQFLDIVNPFEVEIVTDNTGKPALRVKVPNIGPGPASVTVSVIDDLSGVFSESSAPVNFTVLESTVPAPRLTAVQPAQGKPRDQVVITGTGFSTVPDENLVRLVQNGLPIEAQVTQSTATSMTVLVPSLGIAKGPAIIIAQRMDAAGAISGDSNALDFTVTADPLAPPNPTIASVLNLATGAPSGKDGDPIRATGTGFGTNFFDFEVGDLANSDPVISLLLFYQNSEFVNFAFPIGASGGVSINSVVPSGLAQGAAQITVVNFDIETGLVSSESAPFNFTITAGSSVRFDEQEPNDSPDLATEVFFPSAIEGKIAKGDPGSLTINFQDGTSEVLSDLFLLILDQETTGTITLTFTQGNDLDLFILKENAMGEYDVVASSTMIEGNAEVLAGALPAGTYLIGIGAFSGSSDYVLTLQLGVSTIMPLRLEPQRKIEAQRYAKRN